jgi:ribonuclease E
MANKMLIDTTHAEETRVVVLRGNRVEEFDFESANRRQLRGNIYLAKVTRVEPSLQAAFVDYGGNRHGFLAFSEIHPDYYQIPVADRQALIAEEERAHRDAEDEIDRRASGGRRRPRHESHGRRDATRTAPLENSEAEGHAEAPEATDAEFSAPEGGQSETAAEASAPAGETPHDTEAAPLAPVEPTESTGESRAQDDEAAPPAMQGAPASDADEAIGAATGSGEAESAPVTDGGNITEIEEPAAAENGEDDVVESVGGADAMEEVQERTPRYRRSYKIQEVIKRRQIMLVQVVKEERGTKGAALTTYLSLAGRYSVLMPNTARGGGISRKITSAIDRKKLKEIAQDLEVPEGMRRRWSTRKAR